MAKPNDREVGKAQQPEAPAEDNGVDQASAPQPGDGEGCGTMLLAGIMLGTVIGALARAVERL